MNIKNLYQHADDGYYCLLSDDAPMKCPVSGDWLPGVIYMGTDGKMRSTTQKRWKDRFDPVAAYYGDDEAVKAMIRRANPGESDFNFIRVFESWSEHEMNMTGHMIELAVGAAMEKWAEAIGVPITDGFALTITTEDLQRVVQNYEIERIPEPHGFTFRMSKSFPDSP